MRTFLKITNLVLSLAFGLQTNVKAQLVFIPDTAFRSYLNQNFSACMVGDSIDPTCSAVLNAKNINVSNKGIYDLTGIEVFVNDTLLDCIGNQLTTLPQLPNSITSLFCQDNQLTTFSTLPTSLVDLRCNFNQLISLPSLPSSLKVLNCVDNLLTTLPALPSSLNNLSCDNNQLSTLPTLPNSLSILNCDFNQITNLPALPNSITGLSCTNNQLTSLPTLPSSLKYIYCGYNQLTNLPTLPGTMYGIYCNNNQITALPSLPNTVIYLYCYNNQITNLPILSDSLKYLGCQDNQLSTLPALPAVLKTLLCHNNPLTCLPDLKNVTTLNFSNTLVNCVPNYGIVTSSTPSLSSVPLCDIFNSYGCDILWNIEGTSYVDVDSNCIKGNSEQGYPNQKVKLYKSGILNQQTYTTINGNYNFDTFSNGFYKTELDTTGLPFELNCPTSGFYLDTITATDSLKYDRDFGLKCKGADLSATSIHTMNLRQGSVRTINVYSGDLSNQYGAHCADGVGGVVTISITGACNYYSSPSYALSPTTITGNTLTYSIADFGMISYDSTFNFNLLIDTTAVLGSQICITVNISTTSPELIYSNNQLTQCFTVVGSFDPNDKAVYPTTTLDISGNKWLNYTIRFQNTGTAEAEHIIITDTMSNLVDISTFTLLSYSHQPLMQIYNDGLVKFNFPNIHLPDSNTNEPESHGYVQYKIRAKDSLTVGSMIDNTANIFFDFNAPVITNTTSNLLINCSIPKTILNATICGGSAYILNGQEYYNSGVYQQNILTAFGCDSVVELRLTVNTINNTITQIAGTIQTFASATNYQWINCTTGTAIVGANTQTFNPTQSGNYAVVVDFGTCQDTSACYNFSSVGINEISASNIRIQPNPFNSELKITLDKNYDGVLEVYNTLGALITSEKLQGRNISLNTSTWNAGVYILKVATNAGVVVKKVVKR